MSNGKPCLQLDVGNSSAKWRLVDGGEILARGRYVPGDNASRDSLLDCTTVLERILVSSVAADDAEQTLEQLLLERWAVQPWFARTPARTGDLVNSYADPARMGVDRWLAMLGARRRFSGRLCVIDAGSALTIDLVSATGLHEGGYIIPRPGTDGAGAVAGYRSGAVRRAGRIFTGPRHFYCRGRPSRYCAGTGGGGHACPQQDSG